MTRKPMPATMGTAPELSPKSPSISFYTFGCRLNQSETAVIENSFSAVGYRVVNFPEPADIVVVNTCTVTENGDADTRKLVKRINRTNPNARIALVGCQAQMQKEILKDLPNVKWVVGNARKMELAAILAEPQGDATQVIVPTIPRDSFTIPLTSIDSKRTRANIKIQDGCDFFCSFCEIPYARGRARSRVFDDILKESKQLVEAGYKEIILTGINLGTYTHDAQTFLDVIDALEQIDGLKRIRISSIEPTTIPKELFAKMAKQTKLCRYLHIPLQSGDDEILKAMKRKYTTSDFLEFVKHATATVPQICIGTDVIVGFPGETDAHFQRTVDFLREAPIRYFHVFSYSNRSMAKSQHLGGRINPQIIEWRSEILRELSQRKRHVFYDSFVGSNQKVLFEQKKQGMWQGLTDNYLRVMMKCDQDVNNQMLDVFIEKNEGSHLSGVFKNE